MNSFFQNESTTVEYSSLLKSIFNSSVQLFTNISNSFTGLFSDSFKQLIQRTLFPQKFVDELKFQELSERNSHFKQVTNPLESVLLVFVLVLFAFQGIILLLNLIKYLLRNVFKFSRAFDNLLGKSTLMNSYKSLMKMTIIKYFLIINLFPLKGYFLFVPIFGSLPLTFYTLALIDTAVIVLPSLFFYAVNATRNSFFLRRLKTLFYFCGLTFVFSALFVFGFDNIKSAEFLPSFNLILAIFFLISNAIFLVSQDKTKVEITEETREFE